MVRGRRYDFNLYNQGCIAVLKECALQKMLRLTDQKEDERELN